MDKQTFEAIARGFGGGTSRRRLAHLLSGSLAGGVFLALAGEDAAGKKKRKRKKSKSCGPCRMARKGNCRDMVPDGAACGAGQVCQGGACVASTCTPACVAPATCVNGRCECPAGQACGEGTCSGADLFCDGGYCQSGGELCSCPAGSRVCRGTDYDQCCLNADSCDPNLLCVSSTCSAANSFCTQEYAYCNGTADCSCAQTVSGRSTCVSTQEISTCRDAGNCERDSDCPGGAACVNPCCPDGQVRGVCMTVCS